MSRRIILLSEERQPESLVKITEKFLTESDGEEERVRVAPAVTNEKKSPADADMDADLGAGHEEARSSGENSTNRNIDMGKVIDNISADKKEKEKADLWDNECNEKCEKHWNDDVRR